MSWLPILLLILFNLLSTSNSCSYEWMSLGRSCYRVYEEPRSRLVAQMKCFFEGGRLVSLDSQSVVRFLSSHVSLAGGGASFWVGLNRVGDRLVWSNNATVAPAHSWVKTEGGGQCFTFNGKEVTSASCLSQRGFVCESARGRGSSGCNRFVKHSFRGEHSGRCLFRTEKALSKVMAQEACALKGGVFLDLADVVTDGLQAFFDQGLMQEGEHFWTPLAWNGTNLLWPERDAPLENVVPLQKGDEGECVAASFSESSSDLLTLYRIKCDDEAYMLCGSPLDAATTTPISTEDTAEEISCPKGYNWKADSNTGYCFWETSYETDRLSWEEARSYCQSYGGDLASFHSIEEEKIGLSFQYGSLSHPYWIGLRLDTRTGDYAWSDGTPLDYTNWARGQPDHKDMRLRCVSMDAAAKHWVSTLCGVLSWFVCKAPKQADPQLPILPTRSSLVRCHPSGYFFEEYCYQSVALQYSWHRAKEYCENQASSLVSIHSDREIGFLLRLLYEEKSLNGNRVWIGLNSLEGPFRWTDWTPLDFTHWNRNEPNNYRFQEKCCNMYIGNGLWNDENCNAAMGFICKRPNDTSVTTLSPSTLDPLAGHCKKGWHAYEDRCYYVGSGRMNWTRAADSCLDLGGQLASVRNEREQALVSFLLQRMGNDAWIGLHDTVESGAFYWADNSPLRFTDWAPGEPSAFGTKQDCVLVDHARQGLWRDEDCSKELPYLCQSAKDPTLSKPPFDRTWNCIHPEGWLKLGSSCFQVFDNVSLSQAQAKEACAREGARLASLAHQGALAAFRFLADGNDSFWIGLERNGGSFSWATGQSLAFSRWDHNQPPAEEGSCFASSADGFWRQESCQVFLPFACQVYEEPSEGQYRTEGKCPSNFVASADRCYSLKSELKDWYSANFRCLELGSRIASVHSAEQLEGLRDLVSTEESAVFLGLTRNEAGGFDWIDGTPLDFVAWQPGQPQNEVDQCVEMDPATLQWLLVPCSVRRRFLCSIDLKKIPENERLSQDAWPVLSTASIVGITIGVVLALALVAFLVLYRYQPLSREPQFQRQQSTSFENALYNADTASMEFSDDARTNC